MRRWSVILMLLAVSGIATGGLDFAHRKQHQRQSELWMAAVRAAAARHGRMPAGPQPLPARSDPNCLICQVLHSAVGASFVQSAVVLLGLLTLIKLVPPRFVFVQRISLPNLRRGPPAL